MNSDSVFIVNLQLLLTKAQGGSPAARNHLIAFCRTYLRNRAQRQLAKHMRAQLDPSDLAQQTCIKAFENFATFHGTTHREFLKWLGAIQRNLVKNIVRAKPKRGFAQQILRGTSSFSVSHQDPRPTPATQAVKQEENALVLRALARLPEDGQLVIRLHLWEKLSFREIGETMRLPSADAAWGRWKQAIRLLQREMRDHRDS